MIPRADRNMMIAPGSLEHAEIPHQDNSFDRNEPAPGAPDTAAREDGDDDPEDEES